MKQFDWLKWPISAIIYHLYTNNEHKKSAHSRFFPSAEIEPFSFRYGYLFALNRCYVVYMTVGEHTAWFWWSMAPTMMKATKIRNCVKKQWLRGNLSCQKWLLCILPLWGHPPNLWHHQLKPNWLWHSSLYWWMVCNVAAASTVVTVALKKPRHTSLLSWLHPQWRGCAHGVSTH